MRALFLLAALLTIGQVTAQSNCGPAQCYNGCTDARPLVDFVFLFDVSGSMVQERSAVVNGFSTWANNLDGSQINAQFAIVVFADQYYGDPSLYLDLTSDKGTFKNKLGGVGLSGGWESGLEAIRMTLNKATDNFNPPIKYRAGAKRVLILMTDEDSDIPIHSANRFPTQEWGATNYCRKCCGYPSQKYTDSDWEKYWQPEIDATARIVQESGDVSLYLLIPPTDNQNDRCLTFYQYGNPSLNDEDDNFKNWDMAKTKNNFANNDKSKRSLQAQLLNAGVFARSFSIDDADNNNFIKNFFEAVVNDVSKCDKDCYDYPCSGGKCVAPINQCDCSGKRNNPPTPVDCAGVCGGNAHLDCMGVCNGGAKYDACGVCIPAGQTSNSTWCKEDCNGQTYLSSTPNVAYEKTCPAYLDPAGYVVGSNLMTLAKTQQWNEAKACEHWRTIGQFNSQSLRQCTFDGAYYVSANVLSGNQAAVSNPKGHYLTTGMAQGLLARCVADTQMRVPPASTDACGQCVPKLIATPADEYQCYIDCDGNPIGTGEEGHFIDNCGACVPPGTDADANKDSCDVCFGGDATKNECGGCSNKGAPPPGQDACNRDICLEIHCDNDCAGDPIEEGKDPKHKLDPCGFCIPSDQTINDACLIDCKGNYYNSTAGDPTYGYDDCGVCYLFGQRNPGCKDDCAGKPGGSGHYDDCGQCISELVHDNVECLRDCANEPYLSSVEPANIVDYCNLCVPRAQANATLDHCGKCTGELGYNSAEDCLEGCDGVWRLRSVFVTWVDYCDRCVIPENVTLANSGIDLCGLCPGSPNYNGTNIQTDDLGRSCCVTDLKSCANGKKYCIDCPPTCANSTAPMDSCGFCPGAPMYNKTDSCGYCCENPSPQGDCGHLDDCGECDGFNGSKDSCGRCKNKPGYDASLCKSDCLGNFYLPDQPHAVYDCAGICNGTTICNEAVCGDGIVTPPEVCDSADPATKDSCNSDCTVMQGASTGAIIGSVIGAIAALAILGLAAFLGVRYAIKNGLLGSAKQSVDFGASNSNPLYEGDTKIRSNPLYAA